MASILVIDDSPTVFVSVRYALGLDGHVVESMKSALELPTYLEDGHIDLILLDLQMPTFSGFSIGALLLNYDKKNTPIVIYSARPELELLAVAKRIHATAVMEKTRPLSDLRALVGRLVGSVRQ